MGNGPKGFNRKFSDGELRADLEAGLKVAAIAAKYECSATAVYSRIESLKLNTTGAMVAPDESKAFANCQLDVMRELATNLQHARLVRDACHEWLKDAKDPNRYDIGPRAHEILVTFYDLPDDEGKSKKSKATLDALLARVERGGLQVEKAESRTADPRTLVLQVLAESRQIIALCVQMAETLASAQAMDNFREAVLSEIARVSQVDPVVAENIAKAVRRRILLFQALSGPDGISSS